MPGPVPTTRCQAMALAREAGVPVRIIAAHYGVSRQAVYRASRRRGITRPIDQIKQLFVRTDLTTTQPE